MKHKFFFCFILLSYKILVCQTTDSLFLGPGEYINSSHPAIVKKVVELTGSRKSATDKVKVLYEFVRDSWSDSVYDNYHADVILRAGGNLCYQRAILLAALCRAAGIPARLHWQKVTIKNYLYSSGTQADIIFIHGITGIKVNGKWNLFDPVGNSKKWKAWVQKDEFNFIEFKEGTDCLFNPTDKIVPETLPYYFSDYDELLPRMYNKIINSEWGIDML